MKAIGRLPNVRRDIELIDAALSSLVYDGGVVLTGEITSLVFSTGEITPRYSHYLCFTVSERTNRLAFFQEKYTPEQEQLHCLINSLHDDGMGYRKIALYLNDKGFKTSTGKDWKNGHVYSVLKRYQERQERD